MCIKLCLVCYLVIGLFPRLASATIQEADDVPNSIHFPPERIFREHTREVLRGNYTRLKDMEASFVTSTGKPLPHMIGVSNRRLHIRVSECSCQDLIKCYQHSPRLHHHNTSHNEKEFIIPLHIHEWDTNFSISNASDLQNATQHTLVTQDGRIVWENLTPGTRYAVFMVDSSLQSCVISLNTCNGQPPPAENLRADFLNNVLLKVTWQSFKDSCRSIMLFNVDISAEDNFIQAVMIEANCFYWSDEYIDCHGLFQVPLNHHLRIRVVTCRKEADSDEATYSSWTEVNHPQSLNHSEAQEVTEFDSVTEVETVSGIGIPILNEDEFELKIATSTQRYETDSLGAQTLRELGLIETKFHLKNKNTTKLKESKINIEEMEDLGTMKKQIDSLMTTERTKGSVSEFSVESRTTPMIHNRKNNDVDGKASSHTLTILLLSLALTLCLAATGILVVLGFYRRCSKEPKHLKMQYTSAHFINDPDSGNEY